MTASVNGPCQAALMPWLTKDCQLISTRGRVPCGYHCWAMFLLRVCCSPIHKSSCTPRFFAPEPHLCSTRSLSSCSQEVGQLLAMNRRRTKAELLICCLPLLPCSVYPYAPVCPILLYLHVGRRSEVERNNYPYDRRETREHRVSYRWQLTPWGLFREKGN